MVPSKTEEEKELESAIKSLLAALPKETRNCILQLKLPSFASNDEGKIAHDLGIAIDNLIKAQNEQKLNCAGMDRAKDYIVKFYKLTYPFAKMILNFAEQVAFSRTHPYGMIFGGLVFLMQVIRSDTYLKISWLMTT